jgi:hypothetical protein
MSIVHSDAGSILMLDREPIGWRSLRARGLAWSEGAPRTGGAIRSWERAATALPGCGLVIQGRRRFVHSSVTGVGPVYHLSRGDATYFSSRLDALVLAAGGPLSIDWLTWASILTIGWPMGERTQFAEAKRLGPFSVLEHRPEGPSVTADPWPWAKIEPHLSVEEGAPALLEAVRDSVAGWAPASTLCMLSGGLDSRLLLAVLAERGDPPVRAITFATPSPDASIATEVAAALGVPHELVTFEDPEAYWELLAERAVLGDFQYPAHVLWTPLRRRFRELGLPVLDGLAFDTFAAHGGRFYTAEMFDPRRTARMAPLLWRSFRRQVLSSGPRFAFAEPLAAAFSRLSRRQLAAASRPYRGNPNEPILAFYVTRTLRAVSTTPHQVLGSAASVLSPFASDAVARAALRIDPLDKLGHRLYRAVFELLNSPAGQIRSTGDGPRRKRSLDEPRFSDPTITNLQRLLQDSPLAPEFSETLRETVSNGALLPALRDRGAYNSALTLAWFGLWCERYGPILREFDPAEVLELAPRS